MNSLNRSTASSQLYGCSSKRRSSRSACAFGGGNNSCKKRLCCEAEADGAMVVEGGRLRFRCCVRGALERTKRALNSAKGGGLSEGTKLLRNNRTKAEEMEFQCCSYP